MAKRKAKPSKHPDNPPTVFVEVVEFVKTCPFCTPQHHMSEPQKGPCSVCGQKFAEPQLNVVDRRLGPFTKREADKVENGLDRQLDHERFFTRQVDA